MMQFVNCLAGADWALLGRDGTRNSVSTETGAPFQWCVEHRNKDGRLIRGPRGIRWTTPLGSQTFSSPVIAGRLIWIGTNNQRPGVRTDEMYHSVLKCFRVSDGKQVYEYIFP